MSKCEERRNSMKYDVQSIEELDLDLIMHSIDMERIDGNDFLPETVITIHPFATTLILTIFVQFLRFAYELARSKRNTMPEKKLKEITGKTYKCRIVHNKWPNAFTYGTKTIFITDRLVKILSERELVAVLLHEVGHISEHHKVEEIARMLILFHVSPKLTALLCKMINKYAPSYPMQVMVIYLYAFIFLYMVSKNFLERLLEDKADLYASKAGYGKELASALKKIQANTKSGLFGIWKKPRYKILRIVQKIFMTHPYIEDRVEKVLDRSKDFRAAAKSGKFLQAADALEITLNKEKKAAT
jgi:STE24 endopeptidase